MTVGSGSSRPCGLTLPTAKSPEEYLKSAQQVEMLCKLQNLKKCSLKAGFLAILFLNMTATLWAPMAKAQVLNSEQMDGKISGTVLLKANNRPASQVAVN